MIFIIWFICKIWFNIIMIYFITDYIIYANNIPDNHIESNKYRKIRYKFKDIQDKNLPIIDKIRNIHYNLRISENEEVCILLSRTNKIIMIKFRSNEYYHIHINGKCCLVNTKYQILYLNKIKDIACFSIYEDNKSDNWYDNFTDKIIIKGQKYNSRPERLSLVNWFDLSEPKAVSLDWYRKSCPYGPRRLFHNSKVTFHHGIDFEGKIGSYLIAPCDAIVVGIKYHPYKTKNTSSYKIYYSYNEETVRFTFDNNKPFTFIASELMSGLNGNSKKIIESCLSGYGNCVILLVNTEKSNTNKPNMSICMYCHLNQPLVAPFQFVSKGSVIGTLGNTGFSTGPHVHIELRVQKNRQNLLIDKQSKDAYQPWLRHYALPDHLKVKFSKSVTRVRDIFNSISFIDL